MPESFESILPLVQRPSRYIGNELNAVHKEWDKVDIHFALAYPDTYEIGMSNLAIQILYYIVNQQADAVAERVFCPWPDMENQLTTNNLQLTTLESQKPLKDFDFLGFSLGHELTYTNIVTMLKLGGIPLYAKDRKDGDPFILGGGPCAFNPEPVADFFDFFVIGEAEEVVLEILDLFRDSNLFSISDLGIKKRKAESRTQVLSALAKIPGIYVPGICKTVNKRIIKDLSGVPYPLKPIIPFVEAVHDRAVIEIMRGCKWGCKFCQAGWTSRPVRQKSLEVLLEQADQLIKNTGYEELSLISLSSSDHPQIEELAKTLARKYEKQRINIALPSMRMNSFSIKLAKEIARVRSGSVTLAPEAGTQRLRDLIGKNLSEEDILTGAQAAFAEGIEALKLYFMIGLPTETDEDLLGICELGLKILAEGKKVTPRARITINLSTFIPKPHTPLERERQISIEETLHKQALIKSRLKAEGRKAKGIEVKWHQAEASFLEGVFSRGDRQLSKVIEKAWELGARLDAWSEHFKLDLWLKAFAECGIDPHEYLKERSAEGPLPWSYIKLNAENKDQV